MEDLVYYNELFEIYSDLLTDKEKEAYKDYYFEDLSLSEIADNKKVSRAAVQKMVKTVVDKLNNYEQSLHIHKLKKDLFKVLELNDVNEIKSHIDKVLSNN